MNRKTQTALLSVVSNGLLVIAKVIAGLLSGSVSIISEAIHSGVDMVAAIIAYFSVKISSKPADESHPYGHGKFENVSGTVEGLLIFVAAGWIIFEAIEKLRNPGEIEFPLLGVIVMAVSCVVNIIVSSKLYKVAKAEDSIALEADALHLRTDVYTSLGVGIGLLIIWLGDVLFPEYDLVWIDPVIAIIVALMIIKAAFDLTKRAVMDLLDVKLPEAEIKEILEILETNKAHFREFHKFKTRKAGAERFVEFHMVVPGTMTVRESHDICDLLVSKIKEKYSGIQVIIHVEPDDPEHLKTCSATWSGT
ncbi:MAG: cation diffusion facilitator family transporter [Bacteroidetes bacterium]|nr:cation diffusion facilitator family transporter [Bacteroidota bacterium]MBU1720665.1 cation diffusion facilitator family transporter [Bacteroidota bacterium]